MDPTADPAQLEAAARALRQQAHILEDGGKAGAFLRQAEGSSWTGEAARRFVADLRSDASKAKGLAAELRELAGLIEQGAAKIRRYRAEQARLERERAEHQRTPPSGVPSKPLAALPP